MSILTNNKVTRAVSWPYRNRAKLLSFAFISVAGVMAHNNIKPLSVCDAIELDIKNAVRIAFDPADRMTDYHATRLQNAERALQAHNCP